jgi:hypothetical protein
MVYFILFPGYGMTKHSWAHDLHLKKINFLNELKKLGKVHTYTPLYNNIHYYRQSNKNKKFFDENINFDLNYLDVKKHCKNIYNEIRKKSNDKIVVIGHSIGSIYCYYFTKLYKKDCLFSIVIDGMYLYLPNKYKIGHKNITDNGLHTLQHKIKNNENNDKELKKMLHIVFDEIHKQIPKEIIFPVKTVYFRNLPLSYEEINNKNNKDNESMTILKNALYETEKLQKLNKLFKVNFFINKTHFPHYYQECSDEIIVEIKNQLKSFKNNL